MWGKTEERGQSEKGKGGFPEGWGRREKKVKTVRRVSLIARSTAPRAEYSYSSLPTAGTFYLLLKKTSSPKNVCVRGYCSWDNRKFNLITQLTVYSDTAMK